VALWCVLRLRPQLLQELAVRVRVGASGAGFWLWPLLFLTLTRVLLHQRFPDTRALLDDWFAHSQYAAMFVLGAALARAPSAWQGFVRHRWWALVLALMAWVLAVWGPAVLPAGGSAQAAFRAFVYSLQQWSAIVAVLGFAQLHLNQDNSARRYLTHAVFPLYVLHQTLIILLAWLLRDWAMQPLGEAVLIFGGTVALSMAGFELVRRVGWLRPWMGLASRPRR
jgi:glucan biosynthesis protein C